MKRMAHLVLSTTMFCGLFVPTFAVAQSRSSSTHSTALSDASKRVASAGGNNSGTSSNDGADALMARRTTPSASARSATETSSTKSASTKKSSTVKKSASTKTLHIKTKTYTVRSGDTLWSIAHNYRTSVTVLTSLNHLASGATLHIHQKLKVPAVKPLSGRSGGLGLPPRTSSKGFGIAQYAERFIGTPYRWGGSTPSGFDCSGLVQYVYRQYGISLPRTSYAMFTCGSAVSQSNLRPGMMVFFDTNGPGASHVGIYLGGGRFISAAGTVRISSLSEGYWSGHYIGARSVF